MKWLILKSLYFNLKWKVKTYNISISQDSVVIQKANKHYVVKSEQQIIKSVA